MSQHHDHRMYCTCTISMNISTNIHTTMVAILKRVCLQFVEHKTCVFHMSIYGNVDLLLSPYMEMEFTDKYMTLANMY